MSRCRMDTRPNHRLPWHHHRQVSGTKPSGRAASGSRRAAKLADRRSQPSGAESSPRENPQVPAFCSAFSPAAANSSHASSSDASAARKGTTRSGMAASMARLPEGGWGLYLRPERSTPCTSQRWRNANTTSDGTTAMSAPVNISG